MVCSLLDTQPTRPHCKTRPESPLPTQRKRHAVAGKGGIAGRIVQDPAAAADGDDDGRRRRRRDGDGDRDDGRKRKRTRWHISSSICECHHPDVAWSPTASYIATASDDKTLRLWSAETGDAFVEFRGHTNFVFSCRFNPQSNLLVSGVSALARERQWGMASLLFTIIRFPREFSLDFPTLFSNAWRDSFHCCRSRSTRPSSCGT